MWSISRGCCHSASGGVGVWWYRSMYSGIRFSVYFLLPFFFFAQWICGHQIARHSCSLGTLGASVRLATLCLLNCIQQLLTVDEAYQTPIVSVYTHQNETMSIWSSTTLFHASTFHLVLSPSGNNKTPPLRLSSHGNLFWCYSSQSSYQSEATE